MLRKFTTTALRFRQSRFLSSSSDGSDNPKKGVNPNEAIGENLIKAIDGVAEDIHKDNKEDKKSLKNTLINKLLANEKATFDNASAPAMNEMLNDQQLLGLLTDVAKDSKTERKVLPKFAQLRQERRGLVLLRKEVFYQAVQSGYSTDEARIKSEKIVNEAQEKLAERRKALLTGVQEEISKTDAEEAERSEMEQKLFTMAMNMLEKIYKDDMIGGSTRKTIEADKNAVKLLSGNEKMDVFKSTDGLKDYSLEFWSKCDQRAAEITNNSFGPTNSFEEQIEWTVSGKQWEYPINNEFKLGDEENVLFIDHIFLERHLPSLGIPKKGPIAHFMHLVCVGLSKNPYMTAAKKREHLKWFADYFNSEKQKLVHKLHEQEQIAAQNAL